MWKKEEIRNNGEYRECERKVVVVVVVVVVVEAVVEVVVVVEELCSKCLHYYSNN